MFRVPVRGFRATYAVQEPGFAKRISNPMLYNMSTQSTHAYSQVGIALRSASQHISGPRRHAGNAQVEARGV